MRNSKNLSVAIIISMMAMIILQGCERSVGTESDSGTLTVTLAASSPEDYTVPRNSSNVLFGTFEFNALEEDFELPQITLTRNGLGDPADFERVMLVIDDIVITPSLSFDLATNSVTFDLSSDPMFVPKEGSFTVEVRADLNAGENSQSRICITSSDDVVANGQSSHAQVEAQGVWPVCGNFVTTQGSQIQLIEYRESYFGGDINIGDTEIDMLRVRFYNNGTQNVYARQLSFIVEAAPRVFENPTLLKSNAVIGDETNRIGENTQFIVYDLSANPLIIPPGEVNVDFRLDLLMGLCINLGVRFHHTDSVVVGENSEEMILVGRPDSEPYTERQVYGEGIGFEPENTSSATTVIQGADDHVFVKTSAWAGYDATMDEFQVNVLMDEGSENYFTDLKGWAQNQDGGWYLAIGPLDPLSAVCIAGMCTYTYTEQLNVQQCARYPLIRFTMDVDPATPVGTTCAVQFLPHSVQAHVASTNEPILSEYIFGNNTITGNVQTVVAQ